MPATGHMTTGQPASADSTTGKAAALLDQLHELHAATVAGAVPLVGRDYLLRVEGAITAMEAVLGLPSSLLCK